jgi:hypothetical protein
MKSGICNLELPKLSLTHRQTTLIQGIEVHGDVEFRRRTDEALSLLRPLRQFAIIRQHLSVIRQARRSGMKAWSAKPTFMVGRPTWSHSALWYAGAIAHDAYHAKLYDDAKRRGGGKAARIDSWTGVEAEQKCLCFQRRVLVKLSADEKMIDYVTRCARNPSYQGRNRGPGSWLDYLKRRW